MGARKHGFDLLERPDNARDVLGRNANAGVGDPNLNSTLSIGGNAEHDAPALACELDRVGDEVEDDLSDKPFVDAGIELAAGIGKLELDSGGRGATAAHAQGVIETTHKIDVVFLKRQLAS